MKTIIKENTTIYNSDNNLEKYKQKIIKLQNEVKKHWKNYYNLIKNKK